MSVLKLKVSYLLLTCALVGLIALRLPYPARSITPVTSAGISGAEFCTKF